MKLSDLHQKGPLEMELAQNAAIKPLHKRQQYIHKDVSMDTTSHNKPAPSQGGVYQGGHYDAYIEGKPRLKKYFGGSFLRSI